MHKCNNKIYVVCFLLLLISFDSFTQTQQADTDSIAKQTSAIFLSRPLYHAAPEEGWMSDPNGLVYYKGEYHLFYQHMPKGGGNISWGHLASVDLMNWEQLPVAIPPDSLLPWSGSIVVDHNNTAGFQTGSEKTMVAVFTQFNPANKHQKQSIAYSNDKGRTWIKYAGNPVLPNRDNLPNFRDPKVLWHEPSGKWVMVVTCGEYVSFFSSKDLKNWYKESEFGKAVGAHSGGWECPDLSEIRVEGTNEKKWLLIASLLPGGTSRNLKEQTMNSATQYFIGEFNGTSFIAQDTITRWFDYGADNYASITYNNLGNRNIAIGWMSNWQYAGLVPTYPWQGNATLPRELTLVKPNGKKSFELRSKPAKEIIAAATNVFRKNNFYVINNSFGESFNNEELKCSMIKLDMNVKELADISLSLENDLGQRMLIGYNAAAKGFYIDRTNAGRSNFSPYFAQRHYLKVDKEPSEIIFEIFYDVSNIEVFVNDGKWVFSEKIFPDKLYNKIKIQSGSTNKIRELSVYKILRPG